MHQDERLGRATIIVRDCMAYTFNLASLAVVFR